MKPSRPTIFLAKIGWAVLTFALVATGTAWAGNHVVAWGDNTYGQTNVPAGLTNVQAIAAGYECAAALKSDGTVVAWGINTQTNVPAGLSNVVAIAAGIGQTLALKNDGTLVAWGLPRSPAYINIPSGLGKILAIACGDEHNVALLTNGTMYAWGENYSHQTNVPATLSNVVAITAGNSCSVAVKSDGTAWTSSGFPSFAGSPSNIMSCAVVAGAEQGAFIEADGAAHVWGYDTTNIDVVSNAVQVSCLSPFNQAGATWVLRRNGTLTGFGASYLGQSNVWMNLSNVLAVAAGYNYHLAIVGDTLPHPIEPMVNAGFVNGQFVVSQPTSLGRTYRLEYLDALPGNWQIVSPLPGNGATQALVDANPNPQQRFYRVRAGQ